MRSNHYNVTPTRTLRGLLCGALGTVAGTIVWLALAGVAGLAYAPYWLWVQACSLAAAARDRFEQPFREEGSIVWCSVVALGAIVAFVIVADLGPAAEQAVARLASYAAGSR